MLDMSARLHIWLLSNRCDKYWWSNVLFINNFVPFMQGELRQCYYVTWYLVSYRIYAYALHAVMTLHACGPQMTYAYTIDSVS